MDTPMKEEEVERITDMLSLPVTNPSNIELAKKLWKEIGPIKNEDVMAVISLLIAQILHQGNEAVHTTGMMAIMINVEAILACHLERTKASLQ